MKSHLRKIFKHKLSKFWKGNGEIRDKQKVKCQNFVVVLEKLNMEILISISIRLQKYVFERHRKCLLKGHMYYT